MTVFEHGRSLIRPLLLFVAIFAASGAVFWLLPVPAATSMIPTQISDSQLITEAAKQLSDVVAIHISLCTGMFLAVGFLARDWMKEEVQCSFSDVAFLIVFLLAVTADFFLGIQGKYAIADGIMSKSLDRDVIGDILGMQAWATLAAGSAALALIGDAVLTYKRS